MNCFNCETVRACKSCLDLLPHKKTYSADVNMLRRKPANEYYQMLSYYEGKYKPEQNDIDFASARELLMKEDYKMVVERRFERIYNMMECKSYMENEDILENRDIYLWIKTY